MWDDIDIISPFFAWIMNFIAFPISIIPLWAPKISLLDKIKFSTLKSPFNDWINKLISFVESPEFINKTFRSFKFSFISIVAFSPIYNSKLLVNLIVK